MSEISGTCRKGWIWSGGMILAAAVGIMWFWWLEDRPPAEEFSPEHADIPGDPATEQRFPPPKTTGGMGLAEALARRRSGREFADRRPGAEQIGQLCWAAQGITDPAKSYRTAPSAGAKFPIGVYVVDRDGVNHYVPGRHALRRVRSGDLRQRLRQAAHDQDSVGKAPLCLVITMNVSRTATRYGDRAERYCLMECGHVAQNVLLQATALGMTGVPVGAFDEAQIATVLNLPPQVRPAYLLALGYPPPGAER